MIKGNDRKGELKIDHEEIIEFATKYFWSQEEARWNGRQIRNACHTALALAEFRAQGGSHKKIKTPGGPVHLKVDDLQLVSNAYLEFMKYLTEVHDKKGFEMWAKSVNIRAKEKDFARKIKKMYEDMNQDNAKNMQQHQPSTHGLSQAPGPSAFDSITRSPAHEAAPVGSVLTKNVAVSQETLVTPSTHSAFPPGPRSPDPAPSPEQPLTQQQPHTPQQPPQQPPQPSAFGPAQGYAPGPWQPGYYPAAGVYPQPPPGNPTGPPTLAPQPYQPWPADLRYAQYPMQPPQAQPQQNAPVGPYPPQPPPPAAGAPPS